MRARCSKTRAMPAVASVAGLVVAAVVAAAKVVGIAAVAGESDEPPVHGQGIARQYLRTASQAGARPASSAGLRRTNCVQSIDMQAHAEAQQCCWVTALGTVGS
jgi:hypothetical protein